MSNGTASDIASELSGGDNLQQLVQGELTAANLLAHNLENESNIDDNTINSDDDSVHLYGFSWDLNLDYEDNINANSTPQ